MKGNNLTVNAEENVTSKKFLGEDSISLTGFWSLENIHTNPDQILDISRLDQSGSEGHLSKQLSLVV